MTIVIKPERCMPVYQTKVLTDTFTQRRIFGLPVTSSSAAFSRFRSGLSFGADSVRRFQAHA